MSIVFRLPKYDGGFFCQMWKLLSKYLLAKNLNIPFYIEDSEWMYKHTDGWRDYFTSLTRFDTSIEGPFIFEIEDKYTDQFTLHEYREAFKDIIQYNDILKERLHNTMNKYNLNEYDAIMIRRGDKMYGESKYVSTETYVKKLLEKNKIVKKIFVQTDDYNAYKEVCELVKDKNIEVITTCPEDRLGCFVFNYSPEVGSTVSTENNEYLMKLTVLPKKKTVHEYNAEEIKEHVEELLIGLQICLQSRYLVTDYQSNVTRYLVVNHPSITSIDDKIISFDVPMRCPTYGFEVA